MLLLMILLQPVADPPPTADVTPVRVGSWVPKKAATRCQWDVLHDRVVDGETILLSVGEDYPGAVRVEGPVPPGIGQGVYKCYPEGGVAKIARLVRPVPVVPEPIVPRLFTPPLLPVIGGT